MSDDVIQVGLIGIGGHGMGNVYNHVHRNPKMHIRAVCDLVDGQLEIGRQAFDPDYATRDYNEILRDDEVHAIVSSTSDEFHAPIALDCMRAGKDVFVEKPMAITIDQCRDLVRAEQQTGKFVMVGLNRRFAPCIVDLRREMKKATIAPELLNIGRNAPIIHYSICDDPRNSSMDIDPALLGRLNRETCHIFDVTTWLMESEPISVYAVGGNRIDRDSENRAVITVSYENGGVVSIIAGGISHMSMPKERMDIWADGIAVRMEMFLDLRIASDDCRPQRSYCGFLHGEPGEIRLDTHAETDYFRSMQKGLRYYIGKGLYAASSTAERLKIWDELVARNEYRPPEGCRGTPLDKGHYGELEAFRLAVAAGGPSPIGAVDGARAFVMGRTAAQSLKSGRPETIDPDLYAVS